MRLLYSWDCPMITVAVTVNIIGFAEPNTLAVETSLRVTCESCQASIHATKTPALWDPLARAIARLEVWAVHA